MTEQRLGTHCFVLFLYNVNRIQDLLVGEQVDIIRYAVQLTSAAATAWHCFQLWPCAGFP